MKIDFKEIWEKVKTFWKNLSQKAKRLILAGGGAALVLIIGLVIYLNVAGSQYRVIFPGMSNAEATQVYAALQEMDVQPQINNSGQILVPQSEWDNLVYQLNAQGYPKSTLSYDTFNNASGFTSTEFERKTALLFQQQDRTQQTLLRNEGIADATVTFSVPESSNYIWDQYNQQKSTANVTIRMKPGYELTPERVSAVKHLTATSIPNLAIEDVVVIDASTGVQAVSLEDAEAAGYYSVQRLDYEKQISKSIEDKVMRLLSARYGADGVTVVATVSLNYEKMASETKQYLPRSDDSESGVLNHYEESYNTNSVEAAGGVVGEENNTDNPPIYPNLDDVGEGNTSSYHREADYDVGYILTQIEKGEPVLERATVAVIVNDPQFDAEVESTLTSLISRAVNIDTNNIRVTNLNFDTSSQPAINPNPDENAGLSMRQWLLIGLGGLLLLIILIVVIVILVRRAKKRKAEEEAALQAEEDRQQQMELDQKLEEHKRQLQNEAMAAVKTEENAIADEIRHFAQENPEIAAALLRSMLREE